MKKLMAFISVCLFAGPAFSDDNSDRLTALGAAGPVFEAIERLKDAAQRPRLRTPEQILLASKDALIGGFSPAPDKDGTTQAPEVQIEAPGLSYDAATGTVSFGKDAKVTVVGPTGAVLKTIGGQEFASVVNDAISQVGQPSPVGLLRVVHAPGHDAEAGSEHKIAAMAYDAGGQSVSVKLASGADALAGATLEGPKLTILGRFPMHIVCCDCDWKCSLAWISVGYCSKCVSGTVGGSSCCSVCSLPAAPGGHC